MHASAKTLARRQIERQIIEDGTAIWKTKKEIDSLLAAEEKKQQWMMLATYNPWGKPGHGAPMPGALRKTKWMLDVANAEEDGNGISLGRPGHGAPLRTPSGKAKTLIKADPLIRFQFHDSLRRSIENELRYRTSPNDRESYRRELDAIVCEKMQRKNGEEVENEAPCEKRKGWTNNAILNKLTKDTRPEREQIFEIAGGGVELVPLLAKNRMVSRRPLPTTDITRMSRICNDVPKSSFNGREYFRQLCHQISEREKQKEKEQREDAEESLRHFETWKGFWGRPGHGAPKALSQREKLEFLLHRIPSLRANSSKNKSQPPERNCRLSVNESRAPPSLTGSQRAVIDNCEDSKLHRDDDFTAIHIDENKLNTFFYFQVTVFVASVLVLQGFAKQASNTKGAISRQNLSEKNVRLDPLLRRALLRALSELEKEAQEKVRAEEIRYARSEPRSVSGNFEEESESEIQNTADSNYPSPTPNNILSTTPQYSSTNRFEEIEESTSPATVQDAFIYQTPASVDQDENTAVQDSKALTPTVNPAEIASNLISDANEKGKEPEEGAEKEGNASEEKKETGKDSKTETNKAVSNDNEVDIFKAPLVAAFTLHQDSKGTPHSVIPLFRKEPQDAQRQQLLQQQYQLFQQQQQQQQFLQNQFIPSVTITPLSQSNQFSQLPRFFSPGTAAPNFASSTVFPPLVSNSILPQNFPSSVLPPHGFTPSTTLPPFRTNQQTFLSTIAPQRNLSPQSFPSTLLPPQDFSVVQSHNFNFSPTPQPNFPAPTVAPQGLQPISIPPVTLPLQNEPRFQSPIIVPSLQLNPEQPFLNQDQGIRNQFFIEEQNRQRILKEQNRQRQIEEENKQKQIEEQNRRRQIEEQNRQRQIEEQNRQRQIEEQRQRQQLEELNRQRQLEEERNRLLYEQNLRQESQLRQQRQEQGVDFQRSVGFSFNQNIQGPPKPPNAFSFNIQPSQSFVPPLNFGGSESRNRVNRQEGFGSTGNLGLVSNQAQRTFGAQNQFQPNQVFFNFQNPQPYRTIPEEHYRNLPINQFQQSNRFQQFRQQQQNNIQDVNKQLQKLLYQSGVATDVSGQEDLNIVSKVLALNHERSDTNVEDTILRNERRANDPSGKILAVGEIKDIEATTEFIKGQ